MAKWNIEVRKKGKVYHCYAVHHPTGKVEKAAERINLIDAVLSADELRNMLNLYHRHAGKYKGTDKLVGRKVSKIKIDDILDRQTKATKTLMKSHKAIFGRKSEK